jgi:hypothetical protein
MYKLYLEVAAVFPQALRSIEANVAIFVVTYLLEKIRHRRGWLERLRGELTRGLGNLLKFEYTVSNGEGAVQQKSQRYKKTAAQNLTSVIKRTWRHHLVLYTLHRLRRRHNPNASAPILTVDLKQRF